MPGNNFSQMSLSAAQKFHLDRMVDSNRFPNGFPAENTVSYWVSEHIYFSIGCYSILLTFVKQLLAKHRLQLSQRPGPTRGICIVVGHDN